MTERAIISGLNYFSKQAFDLNTPPDVSVLTTQMLKDDKFLNNEMKKKVFSAVLSVEIAKAHPLLFR